MEGGIVAGKYFNKTVTLHVEGIQGWSSSSGGAGIENAAGLCRIVLVGEGLEVLLTSVARLMDRDLVASLTTVEAPYAVLRDCRPRQDVALDVNVNCGRYTRVVVHHVRSSTAGDRYAGGYYYRVIALRVEIELYMLVFLIL